MKKFTFLITILLLVGCDKEDEPLIGFNVSSVLQFTVVDSEGRDLLDSGTPGYLNAQEIRTYYKNKDGEFQAHYRANLDHPRFFWIREDDDENVLILFPYMESEEPENVTLIEWREGEVDTIETIHSFHTHGVNLEEAKLNGELIYVRDSSPFPIIQIVK